MAQLRGNDLSGRSQELDLHSDRRLAVPEVLEESFRSSAYRAT